MECKNAYIKSGVKYVLCKKVKLADNAGQREICHAMCGHQRYCPTVKSCTLLPSWKECTRLIEKPAEIREETVKTVEETKATIDTPAKKNTQKAPKKA